MATPIRFAVRIDNKTFAVRLESRRDDRRIGNDHGSLAGLFSSLRRISQVRGGATHRRCVVMKAAMRSGYAPTEHAGSRHGRFADRGGVVGSIGGKNRRRSVSSCGSARRRGFAIEADCLTIHAASDFVRDWLRKNFADDIRACWEAIVGLSATVEFAVDESLAQPVQNAAGPSLMRPARSRSRQAVSRNAASRRDDGRSAEPVAPRVELTLAAFVVGPSNEYAFRAAELTASGRQQASPVVFCGPTGVGKTHLLRAIAREYRRRHPRSTRRLSHGRAIHDRLRRSDSRQRPAQLPAKVPRRRAAGDRRSAILRRQAAHARRIAAHDRHAARPTAGSSCWPATAAWPSCARSGRSCRRGWRAVWFARSSRRSLRRGWAFCADCATKWVWPLTTTCCRWSPRRSTPVRASCAARCTGCRR